MRKKILLVDDDDELRKVLSAYLTRSGYDALLLPDTRELDSYIERHAPHLVVLDVMMPGEDGLAACRRVRGRGENVPIIMLSARDEVVDRDVRDIEHIAEQFVQYVRGFDPSTAIRDPVDLAALAAERVGRWVSTGNDVRLSGPSAGLVIQGDAIALARLIDNLIAMPCSMDRRRSSWKSSEGRQRERHLSSGITEPVFRMRSSHARSSRLRKCARRVERKAA